MDSYKLVAVWPRPPTSGDQLFVTGVVRKSATSFTLKLADGTNKLRLSDTQIPLEFTADVVNSTFTVSTVQADEYGQIHTNDHPGEFKSNNFELVLKFVEIEGERSIDASFNNSFIDAIIYKQEAKQIRYVALNGDIQKITKLRYKLALGEATSGKFNDDNIPFELTIDIEENIATIGSSRGEKSDIIYIDLRKEHVLQPGMYFDIKLIVSEPDQIVAYLNGLLIDTKPFKTKLDWFKHIRMSHGIARIETLGFVFLKMKNYDGRTILSPH